MDSIFCLFSTLCPCWHAVGIIENLLGCNVHWHCTAELKETKQNKILKLH
ncbi:hypothetical protein M758_6G140500 [Ceratodon purpureus]|nr:hypothetical protein M758_6G140500 [Ceratodon purpureus]